MTWNKRVSGFVYPGCLDFEGQDKVVGLQEHKYFDDQYTQEDRQNNVPQFAMGELVRIVDKRIPVFCNRTCVVAEVVESPHDRPMDGGNYRLLGVNNHNPFATVIEYNAEEDHIEEHGLWDYGHFFGHQLVATGFVWTAEELKQYAVNRHLNATERDIVEFIIARRGRTRITRYLPGWRWKDSEQQQRNNNNNNSKSDVNMGGEKRRWGFFK